MDTRSNTESDNNERFGQIPLFSLFGFKVKLDISWLLLGLLITWTLAIGFFPFSYPGLPTATYWWMGLAGAFGVLFSIVFHEFSHSLVARRYGLPIGGITLFLFGGVSEMQQEPADPKTEFLMAVAGPLASVFLAIVFYFVEMLAVASDWNTAVIGVAYYMAVINLVLAVFNLIPAFPLDGGRMLRAGLWRWKHNVKSATRIASRIGSGFGIVLMVLGVLAFFQGNFIGGMWWFLIGAFLRGAAGASYRQLLVRETLKGQPVGKFMQRNPVTVAPSLSVRQFVEEYIYKYYYKLFPVVKDGKLVGCVTTDAIKKIPQEEWDRKSVGDYALNCSEQNCISPREDAASLMGAMFRPDASTRFMVVDHGNLVGVVSLKDMREMIARRLELEPE